ncbi:unnamed protein product [Lupinus luteus]|uniref:Uncharacterized protein n=1 Tax=Lupinus luteus TaxID=3873 RepID=A0AAV1XXB8_LUPLU
MAPGRVGAFKLRDNRSYVDAIREVEVVKEVQTDVEGDDLMVEYAVDPKDLEWLRACMIGKTVESVDPFMVADLLQAEGLSTGMKLKRNEGYFGKSVGVTGFFFKTGRSLTVYTKI